MSRAKHRRQHSRGPYVLLAVCFLLGACGLLLSRGYGPQALVRLWPWPWPGGDDPGTGTAVIYPGQVIRLPIAPGDPPAGLQLPVPPLLVTGIAAGSQRVALTFDAGWEFAPALPLLDVLRNYGLQVTFFPRGKWLEDHPDIVQRILADGHEIGSHSYTHADLTKLDDAAVKGEIGDAKNALLEVAGETAFVPFYRPPYGAHGTAVDGVLADYGYGWVIMWQVDSLDWQQPGVEAIAARVLERLTDGGIALLHVGAMQTVEALPRIIEGLESRGLAIVKVSQLLGLDLGAGRDYALYTVVAGDTLTGIARAHQTTLAALLALNPELVRK